MEAVVLLSSGETIRMRAGKFFYDHLIDELKAGRKWVVGEEGLIQMKHIAAVILREVPE